VQAVPVGIAAALGSRTYYFVPLALAEGRGGEAAGHRSGNETTVIAPEYTVELADEAICHRNVKLDSGEGVFISARLLQDRFSLAFEFFINVSHAFVDEAGVAEGFAELAWGQAVADVRGETSMDAWECRSAALGSTETGDGKARLRMLWRSICCRWRWTSTTRNCGSGSIRCWLRRLWRTGCGWWRSCFLPMRTMSSRSGTGAGRSGVWEDRGTARNLRGERHEG
jgi:hypothetical protein